MRKGHGSIVYTLLGWLLALSVVPLIVVSWYGYQNAYQSIDAMQRNKLEDTARLNVKFINDWFNGCKRDLNSWSESPASLMFLQTLHEQWMRSGEPLGSYIRTEQYRQTLTIRNSVFERLSDNYTYIYDLFLIDKEGNILYTIAKEDDLGTNLLSGPYANSRFARAYRMVLQDRKPHFSDLEHYEPSAGIVAGFICYPMFDEKGKMGGVMALQLKMNTIFEQFDQSNLQNAGIRHYLVGSDGLLRTKIRSESEVLERRISTKQFWRWYDEHGLFGEKPDDMDEAAFVYTGPDGKAVLGQHHSIDMMGIRWAHISEIDEELVMKAPYELAQKEILLVLASIVAIIMISLIIARRMTRPIYKLTDASLAYINGERDIHIDIDSNDELEYLAKVFNEMIESQKKSERELKIHAQEAVNALEQLKEQKFALDAHAIVAITDTKGQIRFVNEKFEQISGYTAAELLGENHRLLNSGVHSKEFWKEMYRTVSHGGIWNAEVCNRAKDGHLYWVDTTIVPFMGADQKPESYVAIRTDITARKKAEGELTKALKVQKAIFDNAGVSIIMTDTEGMILSINAKATEMLGYTNEELAGIHTPAILHKTDEVVQRAALFSGELGETIEPEFEVFVVKSKHGLPNSYEWTYIRKDGSTVPVYLTVTALQKADGSVYGYIGIASDISKFKEAEDQIIAAKEAAEASARAKSEFLAAMSHEIRTPMNGVIGMLGLLSHGHLNETQRHQVRVAQSSANSLLGLINDILDFSKIEAGKMDLERLPFDLYEELGDFAESIAFKAQEKGLELILDMTELPQAVIVSDPGRLRQILTNLVGNAIKFTHSGEIVIKGSMTRENDHTAKLKFDVSDTGIGIEKEKLDSLFEAFTQADSSMTRKYGGTGLGLAIVKRLCQMMGGDISAASVLNRGSTFTAEITVEISEEMRIPPVVRLQEKRLLIVDDNKRVREVLRKTFEADGLIVDETANAIDTIDRCMVCGAGGETPYDMILIDAVLPDSEGTVLAQEIRKQVYFEQTRLVLMTPVGTGVDEVAFAEAGLDGHFPKPAVYKDFRYVYDLLMGLRHKTEKAVRKGDEGTYQWPAQTRLLLVEDNPTNQIVAQGMLELLGLEADIMGNGFEALEALEFSKEEGALYTLILMDCQMPEMDGYEATRRIRAGEAGEEYRNIPIIAMTANAMIGDRETCNAAGMDDYIPKPVDQETLNAMLLKWLNGIETVISAPEEAISSPQPEEELKVWDKDDAIKRIGGREEFLSKILLSCKDDTPKLMRQIDEAVQKGDGVEVQLHAHSIKGSAGNVSAHRLQSVAKSVEFAAKEGDWESIRSYLPELHRAAEEALRAWESYFGEGEPKKPAKRKKRLDPLRLAVELQQLKEKINGGDYIETDSLPIFSASADEPLQTQLAELKTMIDQFRSDEANRMIETIMNGLE